ncbi:MAG: hypothetical protein HRT89_25160 [Lentisphaeria bacterium]|nr:hypothetical protein [Lentisphaeria bacterium]NQZ71349.1 hypothetical protein [Lentisphaeria bacterium]
MNDELKELARFQTQTKRSAFYRIIIFLCVLSTIYIFLIGRGESYIDEEYPIVEASFKAQFNQDLTDKENAYYIYKNATRIPWDNSFFEQFLNENKTDKKYTSDELEDEQRNLLKSPKLTTLQISLLNFYVEQSEKFDRDMQKGSLLKYAAPIQPDYQYGWRHPDAPNLFAYIVFLRYKILYHLLKKNWPKVYSVLDTLKRITIQVDSSIQSKSWIYNLSWFHLSFHTLALNHNIEKNQIYRELQKRKFINEFIFDHTKIISETYHFTEWGYLKFPPFCRQRVKRPLRLISSFHIH